MLKVQLWERHLLDLAHEALESGVSTQVEDQLNEEILDTAYQNCARITRENSKTFFMASNLLPSPKRRAAQALYAFCRISDDIVDRPTGEKAEPLERLEAWRQQVLYGSQLDADPVGRDVSLAWADARSNYRIPHGYVDQLIDGLSLDLRNDRYETFGELAKYCYGVACTVGLMAMHVTGYAGQAALPYAIRLGVALQLTNILRDVGEDWRNGRFYLPLEELHDYGLTEADISAGRIDNRWRAFMQFQIRRAHRLYEEALPGIAYLHRSGRFAIAAAGELYRAILNQIEGNQYDVFHLRASVSGLGKLSRLPGIWARSVIMTTPLFSRIDIE